MRKRRTARVLLFDPTGDILLIRFSIPRPEGPWNFWAAPGGEIEADETELAAATRELHEELGLTLQLEGPIRTESNTFLHQGEMRANTDYFFRGQCDRNAPHLIGLTPEEIAIMTEIRWWSLADIESTTETIFPTDLARFLAQLKNSSLITRDFGPNHTKVKSSNPSNFGPFRS